MISKVGHTYYLVPSKLYVPAAEVLSSVGAAQVTLILASALLFFVSRTPSSESNYGGYGAF